MGNSIETCSISKLPIEKGDKVALILLKEMCGLASARTFNISSAFAPIYLPIYGKYNGEGGMEQIENYKTVAYHVESTGIRLRSKGDSGSTGSESEKVVTEQAAGVVRPSLFGHNDEEIHRFNAFLQNINKYEIPEEEESINRPLHYVFIRDDIMQPLITRIGDRSCVGVDNSVLSILRKRLNYEVDVIVKIKPNKTFKPNEVDVLFRAIDRVRKTFKRYDYITPLNSWHMAEITRDTKESIVNMILLEMVLERLRIDWAGGVSGSKNDKLEVALHMDLTTYILEVSRKISAQFVRRTGCSDKVKLQEPIKIETSTLQPVNIIDID